MENKRTSSQNRALHLFFTHLSNELNDAGYDMRKVLKPAVDIPWNATSVKEFIWRPIMKAQLGVDSTRDMTTKDIDSVLDTITRHLGEKFGLFVEFPSIETIMMKQLLVKEKKL